MQAYFLTLFIALCCSPLISSDIPDYANEEHPDMLSPIYYNAAENDSVRLALNEIIYLVRAQEFHHPLQGTSLPSYTIKRDFGDIVGQGAASQHHPASDMYVGNRTSVVNIYASQGGIVSSGTDSPKYRHFITVSSPIYDANKHEIAKLTIIYAHVDLDLNTVDIQDGDTVQAGELLCSHLYSGTMGGPHLHYEIRFLNKNAEGIEEFYGWSSSTNNFNTLSSGPWQYGYWDTTIGLGYGNPIHYLPRETNAIQENRSLKLTVFPNPCSEAITIHSSQDLTSAVISLHNTAGATMATFKANANTPTLDLSQHPDGYYLGRILFADGDCEHFRVLKKSL